MPFSIKLQEKLFFLLKNLYKNVAKYCFVLQTYYICDRPVGRKEIYFSSNKENKRR